MTPGPPETLRFGDFELDVAGCELRRLGRRVKLGRQAMDVLILLVQRRRELVLRSDIVDRLWGKDVFVDVETGVNTAISKIRQALRDSADAPTFVETVPARGYRFVAPVDVIARDRGSGLPASPMESPSVLGSEQTTDVPVPLLRDGGRPAPAAAEGIAGGVERIPASGSRTASRTLIFAALAVVAMIAGLVLWTRLEGGAGGRVTLAVLPFENVGSDPAREYLATGLTQETSASLAQIDPERLSVKGRTWRYKGTTKTAAEIGQELSVDYLVESAIRSEGGRVRVTATLLRVRDQEHVWSESYERQPTSLLGLEYELSGAIAEQIRGRLSPNHAAPARRQTQNTEAYDAYLKARYLESRRTPTTNAAAIQLYERATTLDSNYALAWSSLAFTFAGSVINGDARPLDVWERARGAAARAVRANPNLAEAQFAAGYVNWLMDWDWQAAETAFRLAIRLDPSNAAVYRTLGHALSQSGRHAEAAAAMRRTRELEPLEPMSYALSSQVAFQARDYRLAVEYARRAVLIDSELWIGYSELAQAYEQTGETDLAIVALTDAARFSGGNSKVISLRGYLLAKAGRATEAREVLSKLEADSHERYVPPYAMALVHAGLGETDELFGWLDNAYAARDVHLIYLPVDPKWDPYRSDPRFAALLRRCGFSMNTPTHD
jgi:TolB-like protein/DNA-binding winged helix-turn-helix (wHTH) protein/Flp pilus assembly protein TadD